LDVPVKKIKDAMPIKQVELFAMRADG